MRYTPEFSSRFRILKGGKISLVVSALLAGSTISFAAPTGGNVTSGSAAISLSGSVTTINQSSNKASINWNSFSIAPSETVNFVQPSSSSVTLNRVIGTSQSLIEGAMNANGQVFLINPNGVLFADGAQINVGGLAASTLNMTDENFQAGNYVFEGNSGASIINMGTITTANGGYVAMMGKTVQNEGTIVATMGNVQMASGEKISLNLNGNSLVKLTIDQGTMDALVENKGLIQADGGQVYLTTQALNSILDGMVNNTGIIEAKTLNDVTGQVVLYAHGGTATVSGTIDASGGFVETSGETLKVADGTVIKAKKWLLDPTNVIVDDLSNGGTITAATIEANLDASSGEIEIQADGGDITVNQAINIFTVENNGYTAGGLVLTAGNDININNIITVGPDAYLVLNHGWDGTAYDGSNGAAIYGHGGQITFGMNADKSDFVGKVAFAQNANTPGFENSQIYINDVQYTIIRNLSDLQVFADAANNGDQNVLTNGKYVLGGDIDMSSITNWTPIAKANTYDDYSRDFKGSFNGLGNTISFLTVNGDFYNGNGAGLFGSVAGSAEISSVRLTNANVTNAADNTGSWDNYTAPTGSLIGIARGQYDNNDNLVGSPTINNNIVAYSWMQSTGDGSNVGGIVGSASNVVMNGNSAIQTAAISNSWNAGGIVGSASNSTITDSYVRSTNAYARFGNVGGVAGSIYNTTIDGATVSGLVMAQTLDGATTGVRAGGIVGSAEDGSEIKNSSVDSGCVVALQDVGGIVGYLEDSVYEIESDKPSTVTNSFYSLGDPDTGVYIGNFGWGNVGVVTLGALDTALYTTWKNSGKVALTASSLFGSADSNGYYTINSNSDFRKLLALAYDPSVKVKLASSFTLDAGFYLPMFKGEIDGNGKTISGLNVSQGYNSNIGLIGRLMGGTVKNLTLNTPTLDGYAYVGGVAGYTGAGSYTMIDDEAQYSDLPTISNVSVNNFTYSHTKEFTVDTLNSNTEVSNIGAIAGFIDGATLSNLSATGSIAANLTANNFSADNGNKRVDFHDIGGLFGYINNSSLNTANSSVEITATLTNQTAHDNIEAYDIGGLSGSAENGIFQNITASGNIGITLANDVNGGSYAGSIGGAFGSISNSYIKTASATNTISVSGKNDIESVGGFAGNSRYSVYDAVSTSGDMDITVTGNNVYSAGGLLGTSYNDIVKNVTSTRDITLSADYVEYIGGLIGDAEYSNIDTATYTGTLDLSSVNNGESVGGLVGYNYGEMDDHTQVYFSKVVSSSTTPENQTQIDADKAALLAEFNARTDVIALKAMGYTVEDNSWGNDNEPYYVKFNLKSPSMEWGVIKNATATVDIKAPNVENVGGLVGYMDVSDGGQIINSSVVALNGTGKVLGGANVGGLVGYNYYGNITDSHAAIEVVGNTDYDGSYVGGLVGYNEGGSSTLTVSGPNIDDTTTTAYQTVEEAIAALDTTRQAYIDALKAENPGYDTVDRDEIYVGQIYGESTFKILGWLSLSKLESKAVIQNSYATGKVTGGSSVGGLVGNNYADYSGGAIIKNSYATGQVVGGSDSENVGGLVGYSYETQIKDSYASGEVSGGSNVGGLVGKNEFGVIDTAYSTGKVTAASYVGGLVGYGYHSEVVDSYHTTGKVTATDAESGRAGGLVGYLYDGSITDSYATSEVSGTNKTGGLVGYTESAHIERSYATGKVKGADYVGGLVGEINDAPQTIVDSYATGEVSGANYVGGLVGQASGSTIETSYASGKVTGVTNVGGFVGKVNNSSTITNVYANGDISSSGINVGSLIGAFDGSTLTNSYASGKITQSGTDQVTLATTKGLIGNADGDISASFYNSTKNVGMADETYYGKTMAEMNTLSTYVDAGWDIVEDSTLTKMFPQFASSGSIWRINPSATIDPGTGDGATPAPTQTAVQNQVNNVVTTIVNSTTVTQPVAPIVLAPTAPQQQAQTQVQNNALLQTILPQETMNGGTFNLVGATDGTTPVQTVTMDQLQSAALTQGVGEIRVPLGNGSVVDLINGGVMLPAGISQEFYVIAANDKGLPPEMQSNQSSSNNKNKKKK